jgi:integrase/recombinase XerD
VRYPDQKDRNKERKINLSDEFVSVFPRYIEEYQLTDALFPWSPRRLEYILEDIGKAAQIENHISFSMCRWNSALIDLKSGMERDLIRQKLGISKIQWREIDMKLKELVKKHT